MVRGFTSSCYDSQVKGVESWVMSEIPISNEKCQTNGDINIRCRTWKPVPSIIDTESHLRWLDQNVSKCGAHLPVACRGKTVNGGFSNSCDCGGNQSCIYDRDPAFTVNDHYFQRSGLIEKDGLEEVWTRDRRGCRDITENSFHRYDNQILMCDPLAVPILEEDHVVAIRGGTNSMNHLRDQYVRCPKDVRPVFS